MSLSVQSITINAPLTLGFTGPAGPAGSNFVPDAVGTIAGRDDFDEESAGFSYLANDTTPVPLLYFRETATAGEWSDGVPFVASGGLANVVEDTTPQLGGNLDVNGQKIVSVSNGNIDIEPNGTGNVILGNFTFDADQSVGVGQDNYVLTYDNATGLISLEASAGGGGGSGDVIGPASSTDNAIALFDGIEGTLLKNSPLAFASSFSAATLQTSEASLSISANGGSSGFVSFDSGGAGLFAPGGHTRWSAINGEVFAYTDTALELSPVKRLSVTNAGMQLGGSGARVTTILDEDDMASNSATALATQQSIRAYVLANASAGGIPLGTIDAKGDLIVGTANDTVARLPIGVTNGHALLVDSAEATGMKWGAVALASSPLSQFAATTSSQLAGVISDETGAGALVFATSPTLVTPVLGTPASGTLTNCTGLPTAGLLDEAVTFAKMADVSSKILIGRHANNSGAPQQVSVGDGIEFSGSGIRRAALTGDVTAAAGSNTTTIANDAVSNAKLANMATGRVKVRITAGTGDPEDATFAALRTAAGLDLITRADTLSPPTIPNEIEIAGITDPVDYADVVVGFVEIDAAGNAVWQDGFGELQVSVVGANWEIFTLSDSSYLARKAFNGELSPVGLTGWTLVSGTGSPSAVIADNVVTPAVAGEIIRYGSPPYRYFVANSTTASDYLELITTTRLDGKPDIIAPIPKDANFTISESEREAPILLTKTGTGQVITLPATGISVGWTQTFCRATSQAITFTGAGTLLGSDIASVTENKWFGLICTATGTYRFI